VNISRVRVLVSKDWRETFRNGQAIVPLILVPLILVVVIPVAILAFPQNDGLRVAINGMDQFVRNVPDGAVPPTIPTAWIGLYAILVYFFAPLFLVIPVITAMVIGSVSFAGEKERNTLEGLLYSPLTAREFLIGKILVSFLPALALTWVAFGAYAIVVNIMGTRLFGGSILPTPAWLVLGGLLSPGIALLVVTVVVGVSMRSRTVQSAQATAAVLVIPIVGLVIAQTVGLVLFDIQLTLIITLFVWALNYAAVWYLTSKFNRETLVLRL